MQPRGASLWIGFGTNRRWRSKVQPTRRFASSAWKTVNGSFNAWWMCEPDLAEERMMDLSLLTRKSDTEWWIEPHGRMRVPGVIYASEALVRDMDAKVYEQVENVAMLPGIEKASYAMPDAHWGYGFPIGGVAAFDADRGGVVSAGGVGFDVSCERVAKLAPMICVKG